MNPLIQLRHSLHQHPEIAGEERQTAQRILDFFKPLKPDETIEELGGTGLAFIFKGKKPGKRLLFRCELDALPIQEKGNPSYQSTVSGKAHLCGHDGHMAIICGLGEKLSQNRPESGEVVLLFQPAEETGEGAKRVLEDPTFDKIRPDFAFALHNLPGFPLHQVIFRKGTFAAGSTGMTIHFSGKTSHAAHPEDGHNPAEAISKLILALPEIRNSFPGFTLATVIHVELGSLAFGTSAGKGSLSLTLRAFDQGNLELLIQKVEEKAQELAAEDQLELEIEFLESFAVSKNDPHAANLAELAFEDLGLDVIENAEPFRWSEDFGLFSQSCPSYLFGLGAGENCPQLHEPTYDFPDELIETGVRVFERIIQKETLQGD
ncbi:amidohydrolase [Algoriphagus kandeliae]|uniref:Amidohydrolase n=1 Tax=Algoriphagus kandeliae TaxID=2562278 RepID=A0A4Y9QV02_9BACT|nr:amidohydrolase [Algoriphagus kandeliae]TFV95528.1 amidohydrolase [Algoriphagus kandeliae]